jgi:hypothetical protein
MENEITKEDVEATEFEVERIVEGKEQFRIRWSGYEEKDDTGNR